MLSKMRGGGGFVRAFLKAVVKMDYLKDDNGPGMNRDFTKMVKKNADIVNERPLIESICLLVPK